MTTAYPGDASFEWKGINGAKAFQLQITKVSDSKKFKKPIVNETKFYSYLGTYTNSKKIKAGTFYSARVRSYVTLAGTKQKVYSPWSTVITFGTSPKKITAKQSGSGIKIDLVTKDYPAAFGLEEAVRPFRSIMVDSFCQYVPNGEAVWKSMHG